MSLLGPVYKVLSTLAFAVMLVAVKLLADRVPSGEVVFFRSAFAVFPVVAMVWWQGQLRDGLSTSRPGGHVMRSVYGVGAMSLWFAGVQRLPLADALAITYAAPLVVVALAAVLLGEVVRMHRWSAVGIGFLGVLIVLSPHLGDVERIGTDRGATGAAMCFLSAFFMALAQIDPFDDGLAVVAHLPPPSVHGPFSARFRPPWAMSVCLPHRKKRPEKAPVPSVRAWRIAGG